MIYGAVMEVFSFFSGLGFLDLGFEKEGFQVEFVNEKNKEFLDSYKYARRSKNKEPKYGYYAESTTNLLNDEIWQNIFGSLDNKQIGFIGGPPCPDFSVAGKNKGFSGCNGQLTSDYINLILKRKPAFFLFENVKGLYKTQKHREYYEVLKQKLRISRYTLFDGIVNSLEYGVPQYRDRLILIGFNNDIFNNCQQFKFGKNKKYDLKQILSLNWPQKDKFVENGRSLIPNKIKKELTVEYWFQKNNVMEHPNSHDYFNVKKIERFIEVCEGDVSKKSFKRLHRWRFSPTAAYGNNEVHLHPYKLRRISVAEALAIQSLPKWFELPPNVSLSSKFKMVGNGVPFLLSQGIAKDIKDFIDQYG